MEKEWTNKWTNYCLKYDNLKKKVVFHFTIGMGGIGDFFKYFIYLLKLCIENDIKLYYFSEANPLDEFIKNSYFKMNIFLRNISEYNKLNKIDDIFAIQSDVLYIIEPFSMYENNVNEDIPYFIDKLFYFSYDVVSNSINQLLNTNEYISIHLRLGDVFLECDKRFVLSTDDTRNFDEEFLFKFIEDNSETQIFFFCDNKTYKDKLKSKYPAIQTTDFYIGHTSLLNTTREQYLNAVTEFYLLTKSKYIYAASNSGFSLMASKFSNTPLMNLISS